MTKHFTRQKRFSLPVAYLDRISCFETLRVYGGRIFCWEEHFVRLKESCRAVGMDLPVPGEELLNWVLRPLRESGLRDALIRLSVIWNGREGWFVFLAREFKSYPKEWHEKGVSLKTTTRRRGPAKAQDPQIKASQFVSGVLAYLDAPFFAKASKGKTHELLFLGPLGTVAEGSVSNVFIVRGKRVLTPSVASGILRGVTRGVVIELARKARLDVQETFMTRHDVYTADECFLTNTSSEVLPVVQVDGRRIGNGEPGPVTRVLRKAFLCKIRLKES